MQAIRVMVLLGLESWSTRPTGQAVRVMVWLGLESWSDTSHRAIVLKSMLWPPSGAIVASSDFFLLLWVI